MPKSNHQILHTLITTKIKELTICEHCFVKNHQVKEKMAKEKLPKSRDYCNKSIIMIQSCALIMEFSRFMY